MATGSAAEGLDIPGSSQPSLRLAPSTTKTSCSSNQTAGRGGGAARGGTSRVKPQKPTIKHPPRAASDTEQNRYHALETEMASDSASDPDNPFEVT